MSTVKVETIKRHRRKETGEMVGPPIIYRTTRGLAERRERHGIVRIIDESPPSPAPEEDSAAYPDLETKEEPVEEDITDETATEPDMVFAATGAAKRLADEEGVTLGEVEGTGADGRILISDVEDYLEEE